MQRLMILLATWVMLAFSAITSADTATVRYDPVTTYVNGDPIVGEVFYRIIVNGLLAEETQDTSAVIDISATEASNVCGQTKVIQDGDRLYSDPVCKTVSLASGGGVDSGVSGFLLYIQRGEPYGETPGESP